MDEIAWQDFERIDLRCGTIVEAAAFPEARKPAYQLTIDFGELGLKTSSAQITENYSLNELIGMQILAVVNFPPKQIGPFMSECIVCGFYTDKGVVLAIPSQTIKNGDRLG